MKKQKIPEVRGRTLKKSERITEVTFLAPSIIGVLVFFILPFFVVVYYSVIDNPINRDFVFLENFKTVSRKNTRRKFKKIIDCDNIVIK